MDSYASAGSVSEEAFMSIRTVVSLGIEGLMSQKYKSKLEEAERAALHATFWVALGELIRFCSGSFFFNMSWQSRCKE